MNLYVGNLSYQTTEDELREAFQAFGQIDSVSLVKDKFSGESRGFAFIEMPTQAEAQAAMAALNGRELRGQSLKVNEARPRTGGGDRRGGGGQRSDDRGRRSW